MNKIVFMLCITILSLNMPIESHTITNESYLSLLRSHLKSIPDTLYATLIKTISIQKPINQREYVKAAQTQSQLSLPLFNAYPKLYTACPYINLGTFPTPIEQLQKNDKTVDSTKLYIKRDDLSGMITKDTKRLFGGNKVRKLGFLLADAKQKNFDTVITFGGAGSNHALCTATYAQQCGLKCLLHLEPQTNSKTVQRNLLLGHYHQADIREYEFKDLDEMALYNNVLENYLTTQKVPYLIPVGGSNALGTIGFVNAACELKEQIEQGLMPEPDYIYLPFGSMGTAAGLLVGLRAVGLKTKIRAIKVTYTKRFNKEACFALARETNQLLHEFDPSFPLLDLDQDQLEVVSDFIGSGYGKPTQETNDAIKTFKKSTAIQLDVTYTGKAMAALLHDIKTGFITKNDTVLFWNTYCGDDFADFISCVNHNDLPACFHKYFE